MSPSGARGPRFKPCQDQTEDINIFINSFSNLHSFLRYRWVFLLTLKTNGYFITMTYRKHFQKVANLLCSDAKIFNFALPALQLIKSSANRLLSGTIGNKQLLKLTNTTTSLFWESTGLRCHASGPDRLTDKIKMVKRSSAFAIFFQK